MDGGQIFQQLVERRLLAQQLLSMSVYSKVRIGRFDLRGEFSHENIDDQEFKESFPSSDFGWMLESSACTRTCDRTTANELVLYRAFKLDR